MTVPFNIVHFLWNSLIHTSSLPPNCTVDCNAPDSAVNYSHPYCWSCTACCQMHMIRHLYLNVQGYWNCIIFMY